MLTLSAAVSAARSQPDDVELQIAAAYACDRAGDEARAIEFYDAAWRLGVPSSARAEFVVGYGSTLRNVGRAEEAVKVLEERLREHPRDHAARCFHALALHACGRHAGAIAELLDVALALSAASPELARYRRALTGYGESLRAGSSSAQFARVAPVLPTRDVGAALARYRRLGFEADAYCDPGAPSDQAPAYGFLQRGEVSLHLAKVDALEPRTTTSAVYIYVDDADAVYEAWKAAGVEGRLSPPVATGYDMREFAYVDPDGNLLRVGQLTESQ